MSGWAVVATLYLIATPIGNLEDLSQRAARTLAEVDLIAAEDTRVTRKLLSHLGIHDKRLVSLHAHSSQKKLASIIERLQAGQAVAFVSDAGSPAISDPGAELVMEADRKGIAVVPIPGPSAVTTAIMASGIASKGYRFVGFLARSLGKRRADLEALASQPCAIVLFESAERLAGLLALLVEVLGPERPAAVCRELTKLHEQIVRGSLGELVTKEIPALGEVTLVIGPPPVRGKISEPAAIERRVRALLLAGHTVRDAADLASRELGVARAAAYRAALEVRRGPAG